MSMYTNRAPVADGRGRRLLPRRWLALAATLALAVTACDNPLETVDPDIILPEDLEGPQAIPTIVQGAIGDFSLAYAGDATPIVGVVMYSGLLGDEWFLSGTFPTRIEIDSRSIDIRNAELTTLFRNLQRARRSAERAVEFINDNADDPSDATSLGQKAQMNNLAGYMYLLIAESFCSGVPFSKGNPDGTLDFGQPLTTSQIYDVAVERFASASTDAQGAGSSRQEAIATLGTARALLDVGDFVAAATVAASVPTEFVFNLDHSIIPAGRWTSAYHGSGPVAPTSASTAQHRSGIFRSIPAATSSPSWGAVSRLASSRRKPRCRPAISLRGSRSSTICGPMSQAC
jgi:hypothetical protein